LKKKKLKTEKMSSKLIKKALLDTEDGIVVSGISGRFPNTENTQQLSDNLYGKVDMIDDKETRWRHTNPEIPTRSGKISRLEKFDASFFSMNSRNANFSDPQLRVILEHAVEAILDAGVNPKSLSESRTGVYIGCCCSEAEEYLVFGNLRRNFNLTR
jgi:fatty acid synthase, animal type